MCANMEVNLVQQEIPVSKMPSSGFGSNPQGWPEVALADSVTMELVGQESLRDTVIYPLHKYTIHILAY